MFRISLMLIILSVTIISPISVIGHQIFLKNGKIINTDSCWEDNGDINYQRYGTIITIGKEQVEKVVYDNREEYRRSTIFLDDGEAVYCDKIIREYDIAKCYKSNRSVFSSYKTDKIVKIVKGKNNIFFEMPKNAQLKWDSATIYFRNTRYRGQINLLVKKIWTEGNMLYCETETENLKFDIEDIRNVKKGYDRKPEFHEMNNSEREIVKQIYYKKELEKEHRRRSLEEDINRMIRSE